MFRDSTSRGGGEVAREQSSGTQERAAKLRIAGLSKQYGEAFALRPSDLDLRQGEFVTLIRIRRKFQRTHSP